MDVEKRSSKGGFLQLFDWNIKSRKKLFSNKPELPEGSKHGRENFDSLATTRVQQPRTHENGPGPSIGGTDYNCASSVRNDEGYGTKAPGVVARLMGLDSLPTSNVSDPCFAPYFVDSHSFRDSHLPKSTTNFQSEHHILDYDVIQNKLDGFSRNRPIERFQTEMLPPKSARSISVTHHRMLSPIKSPGFILTRNAASIMEAAAKIIEQSPQSTANGKLPSFGSSSVPLRIQDLKEKMEATQRTSRLSEAPQIPKEHNSAKYMKGPPSDRSQSGLEDSQLFKASVVRKQGGSGNLKNKGKSVSTATQAKVNVQKKEGLASSSNRNFRNQKEDNEVKLGPFNTKQQNSQKSVQKRISTSRTSDVLRQNNQKQNCAPNKDMLSLKPIVSNQKNRKSLSTNGSSKANKTLNKVVENSVTQAKKTNSVAADTANELLLSKTKNFSAKKQPFNRDVHFNESSVDDVSSNKNERSVKCNVSIDEFTDWDAVDGKNGRDVVSFTFTSPIKKSVLVTPSSGLVLEKNNSLENKNSLSLYPYDDRPDSKTSNLSPSRLNAMGGDDLGLLLEQKLKELSCRFESFEAEHASSSVSTSQDLLPSLNVVTTVCSERDKGHQLGLKKDKPGIQHDSDCSSVDGLLLKAKQKLQGSEDMEEHSSITSREPSFSDGGCNLSDSKSSFTSNGSKQCLSADTHEITWISTKKHQLLGVETELSDSASSISVGDIERKDITTISSYFNFERSSHWEFEYVREVLNNTEFIFEDFASGAAHKIITPSLFDQLENQKTRSDKNMEEYFTVWRKVLFDCLSECLESRCERLLGRGCKEWVKWEKLLQRKDCLAEESYKEISGWSSMGDLVVDELVDKDMSTQYGKWVDFEIEEIEESVEIEKGLLTFLVDELVADLLSF